MNTESNAVFYVNPEKFITSYHTLRLSGSAAEHKPTCALSLYYWVHLLHRYVFFVVFFHSSRTGQKAQAEILCLLNGPLLQESVRKSPR